MKNQRHVERLIRPLLLDSDQEKVGRTLLTSELRAMLREIFKPVRPRQVRAGARRRSRRTAGS